MNSSSPTRVELPMIPANYSPPHNSCLDQVSLSHLAFSGTSLIRTSLRHKYMVEYITNLLAGDCGLVSSVLVCWSLDLGSTPDGSLSFSFPLGFSGLCKTKYNWQTERALLVM